VGFHVGLHEGPFPLTNLLNFASFSERDRYIARRVLRRRLATGMACWEFQDKKES
jgi:hypothetical protein